MVASIRRKSLIAILPTPAYKRQSENECSCKMKIVKRKFTEKVQEVISK